MRGIHHAAVALLLLAVSAGGAPHRYRLHPNPAITVLSIAEGPDGLLWLAAEDGLYRYDGFHYHKIPGFPFGSARFVAFTDDGVLWCGGIEGLARLRDGAFTVVLRDPVNGMAALRDRVYVNRRQLLEVDARGTVRPLGHNSLRDLNVDARGRLWFVCLETRRACALDPAHPERLEEVELPGTYEDTVPDGQGRLWASNGERAERIEGGRARKRLDRLRAGATRRLGPLQAGRNGQLWFTGETVHGLNPEVEFVSPADAARFPPTAGYEDRRGHFWVAQEGRGLIEWIPDSAWERWYPEDYGGGEATQVTAGAGGTVLLTTSKHLLEFRGGWRTVTAEPRHFDAVLPLEAGGYLTAARGLGVARLAADGRILERAGDAAEEFRELRRDRTGRVWVSSKRSLWKVEGTSRSLRLERQELPGVSAGAFTSAADLELDAAGRLWVGYAAGIAWLDDRGAWRRLEPDSPATMVRSLFASPGEIWVAFRSPGSFTRLALTGGRWRGESFRARDGYGPVDTHFLKRDQRGWVWRGSPEGVHVADGRDVSAAGWLHVGSANGLTALESSLYGFHEDGQGNVWVAGEKGVTRMRPKAGWFASAEQSPPRVTRVDADGREYLLAGELPQEMPEGVRQLRIEFGGLDAPAFRVQPLRYRLLPAQQEWTTSRDGTAEFRDLPDGAHVLEIGYAGMTAVARYAFRTGAAPGRSQGLWLAFAAVAAAALLAAVRHLPWFEVWNYKMDKALFLLRRRFSRGRSVSDSGGGEDSSDLTGWRLGGKYELTRLVSRGGFAAVYEARDAEHPGPRFAVKVMSRGAAGEGWVRDRFAHEVSALRSVTHPGVVPVLDSWVNERGEPCLAMPFIEGPTLREEMRRALIGPARAARILRELGDALAAVHERGIVHRDLKPENLMLARERVLILDFGTAGLRGAENELAATTLMAGSFHYLAPERLTGHYSTASDVYSVGVIALEMLSGKRLSDLPRMFSDPAFAGDLEAALPGQEGFARLLASSFDPDPRRRPADVAAWTAELAASLAQA